MRKSKRRFSAFTIFMGEETETFGNISFAGGIHVHDVETPRLVDLVEMRV